ncbi:MAG TPA: DUF4337 family protein [Candidatus Angelobacter sp.]|jgi:hypothetical protein
MSLEEELKESMEHANKSGEKGIGLTMAVVAVLLAVATLLGHRAHTEEGLLQGKIVDEWNFYQAKHIRAHEYGAFAELAAAIANPGSAKDLALKNYKKSQEEECGSPAEHGCSSPAKDSQTLKALMAAAADGSGKEGGGKENSAKENKGEHESPAKGDAAAKDHGKENGEAKESAESKDQHEGKAANHKPGAVNIQEDAKEMEHERDVVEHRADFYDGAELFLEISIVLCSIALLAEMKLIWQLSFISTIAGIVTALWGMFGVH